MRASNDGLTLLSNAVARNHEVIGILGGMGPAATADFYMKLVNSTNAAKDQDHPRVLIWADSTVPDRSAALLGNGPDPTPWITAGIEKLRAGGATMIAIPCNTAHAFIRRMPTNTSLPIISMIEQAVGDIHRRLPDAKQVGILATTGTMQCRIYHTALAAYGLEPIDPDGRVQQGLIMPAIERIKAGVCDESTSNLLALAAAHLESRGAEVLIAGCTEIPLGLPVERTTVPVVDPAQALIDELLRRVQ